MLCLNRLSSFHLSYRPLPKLNELFPGQKSTYSQISENSHDFSELYYVHKQTNGDENNTPHQNWQRYVKIWQNKTRTQQQAETVIWIVLRPGWQTSLR